MLSLLEFLDTANAEDVIINILVKERVKLIKKNKRLAKNHKPPRVNPLVQDVETSSRNTLLSIMPPTTTGPN